ALPLVAIEPARLAHVGDEQVEPAVAVVVAPGRALGASLVEDAGTGGEILEPAVPLVVVEPAPVARVSGLRRRPSAPRQGFAADDQVEAAIVVVIAPSSRLAGDRLRQPGGDRDVVKGRITAVPEE